MLLLSPPPPILTSFFSRMSRHYLPPTPRALWPLSLLCLVWLRLPQPSVSPKRVPQKPAFAAGTPVKSTRATANWAIRAILPSHRTGRRSSNVPRGSVTYLWSTAQMRSESTVGNRLDLSGISRALELRDSRTKDPRLAAWGFFHFASS